MVISYIRGGVIEGTRRTALRDIYDTESIRHDDCSGDTASVIDVNIYEKILIIATIKLEILRNSL